MNTDIFEGKWKQLKGQVQTRWGKLTNDDLDVAEGHSQYLAGKLQERYGLTKEKAEEEIAEFHRKL
ncbi:MAG TPA: CsbD family protein [Thiopseudomonas sp.]|nr:CsbD family protein [Thiopseudomonas sp.]